MSTSTLPETPVYRTVQRTWRERLFTKPWTPLVATRRERALDAEQSMNAFRMTRPVTLSHPPKKK